MFRIVEEDYVRFHCRAVKTLEKYVLNVLAISSEFDVKLPSCFVISPIRRVTKELPFNISIEAA